MALKTTLEQLEEVQTAITDILTKGQSVDRTGMTLTRATLGTLYAREKTLLDRYNSEQGTSYPAINIGTMRRE